VQREPFTIGYGNVDAHCLITESTRVQVGPGKRGIFDCEDIFLLFASTDGVWDPRSFRCLMSTACSSTWEHAIIVGCDSPESDRSTRAWSPRAKAIVESVDLAPEIFNRVFRAMPDRLEEE